MARTLTFNELRALKDKLPDGSIHRIAEELGLKPETVEKLFLWIQLQGRKSIGVHIERPDGGIVVLDDSTIFDKALSILGLEDYPVYQSEPIEGEDNI